MSELTQQHGLLVLNKPKGPTSAGCLEKIKRVLKQKKIGHAGTLDPMATGVLLVLLGQATKIAGYLTEGGKAYSGVLELGTSTNTYDLEGEVVRQEPWEHLTEDDIRRGRGWVDGYDHPGDSSLFRDKAQGKALVQALARR